MNKHSANLLSVKARPRSATEKPSLLRRAMHVAATTGLAVLLPACGFIDGDSYREPDVDPTAAMTEEERPSANTAQVAETAAARAPTAATASRTGGTVSPTATTTATTTPTATSTAPATATTVTQETAVNSTATATTAGASAASGRTNTIDTIVNDMRLNNDLVLDGVPSSYGFAAGPGHVIMGNNPRGTSTPSWWTPANRSLKSEAWWNVILPWMVIFDGVGNAAGNTRVEMRNLKTYYKSRSSGQWILISQGPVEGSNYPKHLQGTNVTTPDIRTNADGTVSVRPPNGTSVFHGWCCGKRPINGPDIEAIFITMQARLTVSNASLPDDRNAARYLIQVGGDYYPEASTTINDYAPSYFSPGIGLSRSKLVNNQWQSFSFTTVNLGVQDPGGAAISEAQLRAAPPPLD